MMIAQVARLVTVLCAALLVTCSPSASDAPIPTPVLRGGFKTSPQQVHKVSLNYTSSAAYSVEDYADGPLQTKDASCTKNSCASYMTTSICSGSQPSLRRWNRTVCRIDLGGL